MHPQIKSHKKTVTGMPVPYGISCHELDERNQPARLLVVLGPAGTHDHIFVHFEDHCVLFSSSLDLLFDKGMGWSF
jgi:hypothetical protein